MRQKLLNKSAVPAFFLGLYFLLVPGRPAAQNCIPTNFNGTSFNLVCPQTCANLNVSIPHIKGTSDYVVSTISYTPYPFVTASGVELNTLYADDLYSPVITLPFPFCFYGAVYTSCVVGSNGIISFDVSNANQENAWSLTTVPHGSIPQPIPYSGGSQNTTSETYYPKAAIMGAYNDITPLLNGSGQRKIEYSIVGTAPCRKFIVSYYLVPLYGSMVCNNRFCSEQMVLHESTGIIEVFLAAKPVCNAWNEGLAILGLQNWNRDKAVTAPGKNCTVWSENATAYRFTPSGTGSRFVRSELYTLSGTYVSTADTLTTTAGILDVRFLNHCPPTGTTQYEVRTTFSSCSDPTIFLVNKDTISTTRTNNLNATFTTTNSACGPPTGTITVVVPPGAGTAPFTYVLDGGPPLISGPTHTYTSVIHGPHTVTVTDVNGSCHSDLNPIVNRTPGLTTAITTTQTFCAGSATGSFTVTLSNGTGPFTYTLNGLLPVTGASPHTFTGLSAGTQTLLIEDITGCMSPPINILITDGPGVSGNLSATSTTCPTATNGSITANASAGAPPYRFQLDGGPLQSGSNPYTFSNVSAGPHNVLITDNVGCTKPLSIVVPAGPALTASNTIFGTSCNGATDGRIRVAPNNGVAPYTFSLDAAPAIPGIAPYIFTGLTAGAHTIQIFDASGCSSIPYPVVVPAGPNLNSTATKTDILCNGAATGFITINQPSNGAAPYEYSIDGINWQAGRTFTGLTAGTYTARFRSANGCSGFVMVTLTQPAAVVAVALMTPVVCNGESNGIISISTNGGVPPYQYSINNGGSWQNSNLFNVPAGNYTVSIRDANNCIITRPVIVTEPALLTALASNSNATCDGGNNGTITITASGGNNGYQYAINGSAFQVSNMFNVGQGNYTVTVKDMLGCVTGFTTTVGLTFNLFLNPMADPSICEGTSTQLQPVSNATIYSWTPATGLSNPNISNPIAAPTDSTRYYLTAVLGRCTLWDTIRVNVNKAPIPEAGPDGNICYGKSFVLQGSGGSQYAWTPAIYLNTTSGPNPVSTPTLNTTYTLSVIDALGCHSLITDSMKLVVKRVMAVQTFPFDTVAAPGDQIQLLATSHGITYSWSPATGLSNTNIPNPVVTTSTTIGDEITYQVAAVNSEGCKGEGYVHIKIFKGPAIYVPTGFSPNGDGKNDKFTPYPVGIKSYNYFKVFNRWGQVIFTSNKLNDGWDGTIMGQSQPTGIYVWMIEAVTTGNQVITKKGTVTLIR